MSQSHPENTNIDQQPSSTATNRMLALVAKGWVSLPPFEPEHFAELYWLTDEAVAAVYNDGDVQIETLDGTIFIAADDAAGFDEWLTGRKRHSRCRWCAYVVAWARQLHPYNRIGLGAAIVFMIGIAFFAPDPRERAVVRAKPAPAVPCPAPYAKGDKVVQQFLACMRRKLQSDN